MITREALIRKLQESGVMGSFLYYLGRFCSKAQMRLVGWWIRKHGHLCENRIVFKNRQFQDFTDNARALFEYIVKNHYNEKYEIIWMVSDKKSFRKHKYKNVKFVTAENKYGWSSISAFYYGNTAKYFFYTNHSADLNRFHSNGQITVNLWHGCGYKGSTLDKKNIPHSDTMGWFDYALVPGNVFVDAKAQYWHCAKAKILPLGYPRYDWMLHPSLTKEEILDRLFGWNIRNPKAVIWMPTFRRSTQSGYGENEIELPFELPALKNMTELKKLDSCLQASGLLLIIKKHPLQIGWDQNQQGFSNIRYVTENMLLKSEIQLYELVGICDGLLSDYSSIAVDYMLMDRPIGFVLTDFEMYKEKRGFVFDNPLDYMPGEKIYDFSGVKLFLEHVAEGKDLYKPDREKLMPCMHVRRECYCKVITEYFGING